jgi:glycine cleavage system transcriptional repressor
MDTTHRQYVISVMARDRIGIVAEVAGVISSLAGDITDLRQSVLADYFTMILLARFPEDVPADVIQENITAAGVCSPYGAGAAPLEVLVQPAPDVHLSGDTVPGDTGQNYLLTARGPDRIGFVAAVSSFCAANGLNILDLATTVFHGDYVMMLLVDVSRCDDLDDLRRRLKAFGDEAGLQAVLQHEAIFRATNEVDR